MIGGALWLMAPLADALRRQGIEPVFAFSVREAGEQIQADGSTRKVAIFRHSGWVVAVTPTDIRPAAGSVATQSCEESK